MCGERMIERIESEYEFLLELKKLNVNETLKGFLSKSLFRGKKECKNLFTNKLHYAIFKNLPRFPVTVCVSPSYAVFVYEFKIGSNTGVGFYLFGVNSDSKIFINQLDNVVLDEAEKIFEIIPSFANEIKKPIIVYKISDKLIHNNLGYQVDLENESDKTIPRYFNNFDISKINKPLFERAYLSYRIQGDIVMNISDSNDYFVELENRLGERIDNIITNIVLQRISAALGEIGISANVASDSLWFDALPRRLMWRESEEMLENLRNFLIDNVDIKDLEAKFVATDPFRINHENAEIALIVREGRVSFGDRFRTIVVEAFSSQGLLRKWTQKVISNVSMDKDWRILRVGRHLIRYHGYPNRLTISARLFQDIDGNDEYIIPVRLDRVYVSAGELYVYHPEHGQNMYKIAEDISARFESTNVSRDFENKMNYYALKYLSEFMDLKKFYKLA